MPRQGELDHAFEWFDKALADGMLLPRFIRYRPELDSLRKDPRFVELLLKQGREIGGRIVRSLNRKNLLP